MSPGNRIPRAKLLALTGLLAAFSLTGCETEMSNQPRLEAYEASSFFANGQAGRPLVEGTVARGHLRIDDHRFQGKVDGKPAETFPQEVTREMLARGQERFNIFCSKCHDRIGNGQGMVVRRGFPRPPSYHIDRLRNTPVGHYFDVITNGFGRMPDLASQVPVEDRWAIIAYVRALQLSQHAEYGELPRTDQNQLDKQKASLEAHKS